MNKREALKIIGKCQENAHINGEPDKVIAYESAIDIINQIKETEKPAIPKFMAEWFKKMWILGGTGKNSNGESVILTDKTDIYTVMNCVLEGEFCKGETSEWINENRDLFAKAWLNGYVEEKEKQYSVAMTGIEAGQNYLYYRKADDNWNFGSTVSTNGIQIYHTRRELENAGFGWVFDSPGIEIEEVE